METQKSISSYGLNERFKAQALQYPQYTLARVVRQHRGAYFVMDQKGENEK